ncbi:MAG: hypothetical protein J6O61_02920 [Butyrivibrio sp.]|uniref:hypothetical protein n=1 Tax=Butyrivibrio sp. TaxID=28121 RepID=UPI001B170133|nr:hypothetical protein [Butyrivibrio sp.]MBO6239781.1 hypothetical protein [Butyrivibrio sp.]
MKKRFLIAVLSAVMALPMAACGADGKGTAEIPENSESADAVSDVAAAAESDSTIGIANPWHDCTEEEAYEVAPNLFSVPEGATNVVWSMMDPETSESEYSWPLVQMTFDLDGNSFVAREQYGTSDPSADISGLYYNWTAQDDITLANWAGGNMTGVYSRYIGDDKYVDLVTWYDIETGASYALSVEADNLDGFDLQAVAEAMYDESKQIGANIPEDDEYIPTDITGCETFTQIVDKLTSGQGYANATIDGTDVLLVTNYTFNNDVDGGVFNAAIDSEVYRYNDSGVPEYIGYVKAGGTAYPLAIYDGKLYAGGNHGIRRFTITDGIFCIDEEAYVEYDTNGDATYYHHSDLRELDGDENAVVPDDSAMLNMYADLENAEVIEYSVVQ